MLKNKLVLIKSSRTLPALILTATCLVISTLKTQGQEALRVSTASDLAAAFRAQSAGSAGYYNLLLGPTAWRFSSGLNMSYNDNIHLQQNNAQSDFIFSPHLDTQMHWPVTEMNSLDVSLNVGYSFHVNDPSQNQFYISPESSSGISFDIRAGDWVFNLHDRISITQNTYETPGVSKNGTTANLENTAGTSATWNLNKAVLSFNYDHGNFISLNSGTSQPDSSTENMSVNGGLRVLPELLLGVEAGSGLIRYDQSSAAISDAWQWNAGAFCTAQISDYISTRLDAGYTMYLPDTTPARDHSSLYFQFLVSHRINKYLNYSLSAKRSTDFSAYGQPQSYYAVGLQPNWHIFEKISLSTPVSWQHGTQLAAGGANYDQYSAGINIGRGLTKKLSSSISYQFVKETSSQANLNYIINIVSLNFTYQF